MGVQTLELFLVFSWAPMALEMTCRAIGLFNSRTPRRKASLAGIGYLSHRHNNFAYRNGIVVAALEVYHAASDSRRHFFEELAEDGRINFRLMAMVSAALLVSISFSLRV